MKQLIALLSMLTLMVAPTMAQGIPDWAEPNERKTYERTYQEQPERLTRQTEHSTNTSKYFGGWEPPCKTERKTYGVHSVEWCSCAVDNNFFPFGFSRLSKKCDALLNPPNEVPIDNPYGMGFLILMGASYAIFKLS